MKKDEEEIFNLFANCIPVKGNKRSIICDVYREKFRFIPNALFFILTKLKGRTLSQILEYFDNKNEKLINEYFDFLKENEFGFFCSKREQKLFPKLNMVFDNSSIITNCIIDINRNSSYDFEKLFLELEYVHCRFWQIRFYGEFGLSEVEKIIVLCKNIHLNSIHLIIPYQKSMDHFQILKFYNLYPLARIDFYDVPPGKMNKYHELCKSHPIRFYEAKIFNEKHCGQINDFYFNPSLKLFSESLSHNTCLNQKISVNVDGEIKNCPSMSKSYGNIKNITLCQALNKSGFKDVWAINKDEITGCKDCEFRHICTDCRAYLEKPDDIYSKPLKCGYSPYTGKWEEWSSNPLKQKAIEHYEMQELN
ncbi:MAG TPA: grasp-with-spasm system SPASM domain peptide maturase [Bacteroidia bacterium]|jgi:SPASM domain peptide maturase of grasp-with-spasm system|nr:grasp-with-spasm system SPASM domain peptide maturase [Bacteroidia bacterium]